MVHFITIFFVIALMASSFVVGGVGEEGLFSWRSLAGKRQKTFGYDLFMCSPVSECSPGT